jgi:type II secretory pathway pseudopilin PulG
MTVKKTLIWIACLAVLVKILVEIWSSLLLRQSSQAKQSEARQNVRMIIRRQQSYFTDKAKFTDSLTDLNVNVVASLDYAYILEAPLTSAQSFVVVKAVSKGPDRGQLEQYFGVVRAPGKQKNSTLEVVICKPRIAAIRLEFRVPSVDVPLKCPESMLPVKP